jgi:20S proteasome alpha/beta subunit
MTLTVALVGKDGIVVGADSRGTFGDVRAVTAQNDTMKKVHLMGNVGVTMAGVETGYQIIEEVRKIVEEQGIKDATDTFAKLREISRQRFNEWFDGWPFFPNPGQNQAFMRPSVQFSLAGYDTQDGQRIPRLYSMMSNVDFAPNLHTYGFALAGVASYALYLLNRLYGPDMSIKTLKRLAAYVITETATQDGKVGGPVQLGIVIPNGKPNMLTKDEVDKINEENGGKSSSLKDLFAKS